MIAIINYGLGNISAFQNIYKRLNIPSEIVSDKKQLEHAKRIILPGVGSFDWAMNQLNNSGMRESLDRLVLEDNLPVLGICVGMQIMANRSDEGESKGLGWINAEVKKFHNSEANYRFQLPHMGWNDVYPDRDCSLFDGLDDSAKFYFLHSYYFSHQHDEHVIAKTDYHSHFTSAVRNKNVYGVQFHPEKSHGWGIRLLKNFSEI